MKGWRLVIGLFILAGCQPSSVKIECYPDGHLKVFTATGESSIQMNPSPKDICAK
jgi:hypothetical protein